MQSDVFRKRKSAYFSPAVWLSACCLTLLVLATAAILGSCLYSFVHRSDYVIDLCGGSKTGTFVSSGKSEGVTTHSSQLITTNSSADGKNTASASDGKVAMNVSDASQVWVTDSDIELFHTSYKNADGVVTVESANGDNVVAPGTDGKYTFSVKNTGKKAVDCKVWMETQMDFSFSSLPFQVRLSSSNGWLIGGEEEWESAQELNQVSVTEYIPVGKSVDYTMYWRWPFEDDIDIQDTNMGNITATQEMDYTMTIHTQATESTRKPDQDIDKKTDTGKEGGTTVSGAAKTGDNTVAGFWIGLLTVSGAVILWDIRKKKLQNKCRKGVIEDDRDKTA